jgi:hypothetical protein
MKWARRWIRRVWLFVRGNAIDRAMDDELRHHVECETAERIRSGLPPDQARAAALRDFGSLVRVKEDARDARGTRPLDDLVADTREGQDRRDREARVPPQHARCISMMALGASGSAVTAMMVRQALARAAIGVSAGGLLALLLARSMRSLLFGVGPADPVSYLTIGLFVAALAAVGAAIPTIQAVRASPLVALREG